MQYLKTHYGRAIPIIPSDTVNIPNPANAGLSSVTNDESVAFQLTDISVTFTTNLIGNIIIAGNDISTVVGFVNENTLILADDIGSGAGVSYTLYVPTPNEGCSVYISSQPINDIAVMTIGGDIVTFNKCGDNNASMILPIQVLRVLTSDTSLTNLVALW